MKNKSFFTNPDLPQINNSRPKHNSRFFDFRIAVELALMELNVPFEKARVAVIDLKTPLFECFREKFSPLHAAKTIMDDVRRIYNLPV